jgi:hypothetical protein
MKFSGKMFFASTGEMVAVVDSESYHISKEHCMYDKIYDAYVNDNADDFVNFCNVDNAIVGNCNDFEIENEAILYKGKKLNNAIGNTIKEMIKRGLDIDPMLRFLDRTIESNSKRVIDELFNFIESCNLSITEDGCFLAYKTVTKDYKDKYSKTYDNHVGVTNSMPKCEVDDDCTRVCSDGFHVGGLNYSGPNGWYTSSEDRVMICKIAPENVVSVPKDHNFQKLRCCEYTVVGEYKLPLMSTVYDEDCNPKTEEKTVTLLPEHMMLYHVYEAKYDNDKTRYFIPIKIDSDSILAELVEPENCTGEKRRFKLKKLSYITDISEEYYSNDY